MFPEINLERPPTLECRRLNPIDRGPGLTKNREMGKQAIGTDSLFALLPDPEMSPPPP